MRGPLHARAGQPCEKVRSYFARAYRQRFAVLVAAAPPGIVPSGDGDIRVPELLAHVAELDTGREELRGVGVPQILEPPVADPGRLADAPPVAVAEVVRLYAIEDLRLGARGELPALGGRRFPQR